MLAQVPSCNLSKHMSGLVPTSACEVPSNARIAVEAEATASALPELLAVVATWRLTPQWTPHLVVAVLHMPSDQQCTQH
jgi:hypothetical protein